MKPSRRRRRPPLTLLVDGGRRLLSSAVNDVGYSLDGPRPSRGAVACLVDSLRAEQIAAADLSKARDAIRDCLAAARRDGATYTAIAAAIVRPGPTIADTIALRRRMAQALTFRVFESRRWGKRMEIVWP